MTGRKFLVIFGVLFLISLLVYILTTPRGNSIPLTGIVDGNEVIVSPQMSGRIVALAVDEGSEVKKNDPIAKLDPTELEANLAAAKANVASLEAQVREANRNYSLADEQTGASVEQARANVVSSTAQIEQVRVALARDKDDLARMQKLFEKGEVSAQDRDHAEAAVRMSQASVDALEEAAKAQSAGLHVAQANRGQVSVRQTQISNTLAQLQQARATAAQVSTQLGYTKIYAPIDGIVSVRVAKQGEVVAAGSPIVVLVDINHLWVRAEVEESYIDSIQFGQTLRVQLPSGEVREGQVFFKGVEGDYATQRDVSRTKRDIKTFAIKVSLPNADRRLFTGMTATVLLPAPDTKKNWFGRL